MDKEELKNRVRLTEEETEAAWERGARCLKDLVARGEKSYSKELLIAMTHKSIVEAQLNKVLNDKDIVMIDRERELPENIMVFTDAGIKTNRELTRNFLHAENIEPVISLAEKEVEG